MIVRGAHAVRQGEPPSFAAADGLPRDLFLIERDDPRAALDEIVSRSSPERLPEHYGVDPVDRHPGLRARLPGRARHRRAQHAPARRAQPARRAGARRPPADRRQADALRPQPARARADERHDPAPARRTRGDGDALIVEADGRDRRRCPRTRRRGSSSPTPARSTRARGSSCRSRSSSPTRPPGAYFLRREMLYTAMTRARAGDADRRPARGRRPRGGDARHLAPPLTPRRTTQPRVTADGAASGRPTGPSASSRTSGSSSSAPA